MRIQPRSTYNFPRYGSFRVVMDPDPWIRIVSVLSDTIPKKISTEIKLNLKLILNLKFKKLKLNWGKQMLKGMSRSLKGTGTRDWMTWTCYQGNKVWYWYNFFNCLFNISLNFLIIRPGANCIAFYFAWLIFVYIFLKFHM